MSEDIGHNSHDEALKSLVASIIHGEREKAAIQADIATYYESAKEKDIKPSVLRAAVKLHMETPTKREDRFKFENEVEETYRRSGGFLD